MYKILLDIFKELLHSAEKEDNNAKVFVVQKKADGKTQMRFGGKNDVLVKQQQ
jgi:hypothetical protein